MNILRSPVESSAIVSIGYAPDTKSLELEFVGGSVYRYRDVPADIHAALINAASKGAYFTSTIRPIYSHVRVRSAAPFP